MVLAVSEQSDEIEFDWDLLKSNLVDQLQIFKNGDQDPRAEEFLLLLHNDLIEKEKAMLNTSSVKNVGRSIVN